MNYKWFLGWHIKSVPKRWKNDFGSLYTDIPSILTNGYRYDGCLYSFVCISRNDKLYSSCSDFPEMALHVHNLTINYVLLLLYHNFSLTFSRFRSTLHWTVASINSHTRAALHIDKISKFKIGWGKRIFFTAALLYVKFSLSHCTRVIRELAMFETESSYLEGLQTELIPS